MLRLSVSELSTMKWSFEEDVLHYHSAGYSAIGIWLPKLAAFGEEKGVELLREYGLAISSIQSIGGFTGCDGRSYRHSMYHALDAIQLAADIGAQTVTVITGGRGGHTDRHSKRILLTALRILAEAAQAVGIQLALEPMHVGCSRNISFINTIPQCLDIIGEVGNPHLGMVFDCYHLAQEATILHRLESIVPHVRLVQLGDARQAPSGVQNRCMLGQGCVPLSKIVTVFQRCGYRGFYEIEISGRDVDHLRYEQILGYSRFAASQWQQTVNVSL
ncbi:MAG: sugar phosphate isomerase/epimerase [Planctomycetales bacterium]|nr:sugar phosphate isomerase/epimerase [Planctomycetales bacterium]